MMQLLWRTCVGRAMLALAAAIGAAALTATPAAAHGITERYDLPAPLGLYLTGAGAAVALSFILIGLFVRADPAKLASYPRVNLLRWRAVRFVTHPAVVTTLQVGAVALLGLVIAAGVAGDQAPSRNLAPTLVWIIWWVGMAYASALVGDVWRLVNPWSASYAWAERGYRALGMGGELGAGWAYPRAWGAWPAAAGFAAFAWVEIVYMDATLPGRLAQLTLLYTVYTWGGMFLFGRESWLRNADVFSMVFGLLARFSPTELRVADAAAECARCAVDCGGDDGDCVGCPACYAAAPPERRQLNLRPYAVGLLGGERSPSVMVFVLLLLSTVSFDGFAATPLWGRLFNALFAVVPNATLINTLGLVGFAGLLMSVYALFCGLVSAASGFRVLSSQAGQLFVLSLVPIALAYHLAHFFTYLLIQGQSIIPLVSDPFGAGWDLFGTAGYALNNGIVGARTVWALTVGAIVVGHAAAVYLAHATALRAIPERQFAFRSQFPMLALMVGYTMVSLWILAQPIVNE